MAFRHPSTFVDWHPKLTTFEWALCRYDFAILEDDAGGDGGSATLAVERGRGFLFPISRDFDRSGGIDSERKLLTRAGSKLAPLRGPTRVADVPAMNASDAETPAIAAPTPKQGSSEWLKAAQQQLPANATELQRRRLLVEEAEKRAAEARAMVALAKHDVTMSLNPSAERKGSGTKAAESSGGVGGGGGDGVPDTAEAASVLRSGSGSATAGSISTAIDKSSTPGHAAGLSRDEQRQRLQAVDRLRGEKAFRVAVRVAVVRWKNAVSKRKLRDKLGKAALGRELAVKVQHFFSYSLYVFPALFLRLLPVFYVRPSLPPWKCHGFFTFLADCMP